MLRSCEGNIYVHTLLSTFLGNLICKKNQNSGKIILNKGRGIGMNTLLTMVVSGKSRERLIRQFFNKTWRSIEDIRQNCIRVEVQQLICKSNCGIGSSNNCKNLSIKLRFR